MNHLVFLIMDSCRHDAVVAAATPHLDRLGTVERRWSYASWTAPAHHAFLMGLMPHQSPPGVFASEVYKQEFARWTDRLGVPDLSFRSFVPTLNLPGVLRRAGYRTNGLVSLPVLNPYTTFSTGFDRYELWPSHADFAGMLDAIDETGFDEPQFWFLNLGETHYPYMLDDDSLPHLSGVHGVYKRLDDAVAGGPSGADADGGDGDDDARSRFARTAPEFFDDDAMTRLRDQQVRCVEYLDGLFGRLFDLLPADAWVIITADHGELFGEGGYFGHGPVMHPLVFEVPFVEGRVPKG